jgi:DNA polymerase
MPTKSKQTLLDQIKADIVSNNVCPHLAETATNLVMGDGHPGAEIVFIGEAPGKNEDEQGLPFVGAAGKFLNEMLAGIGMDRQDVYITNIVKYRPPNNRDPEPEEKKAFWPYLVQQLDVIEPKLVVTLGRHSMEYFLPSQRISVIHGQPKRIKVVFGNRLAGDDGADAVQGGGEKRTEPYEKYGEGASEPTTQQSAATLSSAASSAGRQAERSIVILPLYHPAAALYNGSMRQTLVDDFSNIPLILKKL